MHCGPAAPQHLRQHHQHLHWTGPPHLPTHRPGRQNMQLGDSDGHMYVLLMTFIHILHPSLPLLLLPCPPPLQFLIPFFSPFLPSPPPSPVLPLHLPLSPSPLQPHSVLLAGYRHLHKGILACITSSNMKVVRYVHGLLTRLMQIFPMESSESLQHSLTNMYVYSIFT